jgi:hypothetical protein
VCSYVTYSREARPCHEVKQPDDDKCNKTGNAGKALSSNNFSRRKTIGIKNSDCVFFIQRASRKHRVQGGSNMTGTICV